MRLENAKLFVSVLICNVAWRNTEGKTNVDQICKKSITHDLQAKFIHPRCLLRKQAYIPYFRPFLMPYCLEIQNMDMKRIQQSLLFTKIWFKSQKWLKNKLGCCVGRSNVNMISRVIIISTLHHVSSLPHGNTLMNVDLFVLDLRSHVV